MFNLLLKTVNKFQKENKTLRKQNKNLRIELERIQVLLLNAQKDVEYLKENYKLLKSNNKSLSDALKNSITYFKLDEADYSKETLQHAKLVEERILIDSTHRKNGLLYLNSHN